MLPIDTSLIKMLTDHYWVKHDKVVNKTIYKVKTFFDKFEKVNKPLTQSLIREHGDKKIILAHSLITKFDKFANIVFDYI